MQTFENKDITLHPNPHIKEMEKIKRVADKMFHFNEWGMK